MENPDQFFEYMHWLLEDFNRFKPEYREFLEIQDLGNEYEKIKGLKTYLDKYPDSLLARYAYTVVTIDTLNVNDVDKVSSLCEDAKKAWAKAGFPSYLDMEHQDKLDIICFTIHLYQALGMYSRALELIQYIDSKTLAENPPRFERMMLSTYNQLFRYDLLQTYYRKAKSRGEVDDVLLFHLAVAEFLRGESGKAGEYFEELNEVNPYTEKVFTSPNWLTAGENLEVNLETYKKNSKESLLMAISPLASFIVARPLLHDFLTGQDAGSWSDSEDLFAELESAFNLSLYPLSKSKECQGVQREKLRILNEEGGIKTPEDFKNVTEKELLALKGIGPVTINQLKENGMVFKK